MMKPTQLIAAGAGMLTVTSVMACEVCDCEPAENPNLKRDREAILAMAGEYDVKFHFKETLALQPEYELTKAYDEEAKELVVVVEDSEDRIVLQHLLIVGKDTVVKHWGQIWTYEDTLVTGFQGDETWETSEVSTEAAMGKWSQFVTQTDESPRYEALGNWVHTGERSEWVSEATWRPLPRREYTKRSDYDVLVAVNRHTITPAGWAHEQDNTKLVHRDGEADKLVSREFGLNHYNRISKSDGKFTPATEYWEKNGAAWRVIFDCWYSVLNQSGVSVEVKDKWRKGKLSRKMTSLVKKYGDDLGILKVKTDEALATALEVNNNSNTASL